MRSCRAIMAILLCTTMLFACSENDEKPAEPGSIRSQAEEIGHEAAQTLQEPINQARDMRDLETKRIKELEERLNN